MSVSSDILSHLFTLPPSERYSLAQQLLDSIDDSEAAKFDAQFLDELQRRREEMLRGDQVVPNWRDSLGEIERSLTQPS
jgi:putative addiction module component (TIGR02574 family)